MADTQKTKAQLLALYADNVVGGISAQDFRDGFVTIMQSEFVNAEDFWADPQAKYTLTDKTARGWILYSQYAGSALSFGNILFQEASTGYWMKADAADSTMNGILGLAMDSYSSDASDIEVLRRGVVYDSSFSTVFSEKIGQPIYLESGVAGSISAGATTLASRIIGFVDSSDDHGGSAIGKWFFDGLINWNVSGT